MSGQTFIDIIICVMITLQCHPLEGHMISPIVLLHISNG